MKKQMNLGKVNKMKGLAQIPLMIGLLIMAVVIPVTVKLVQQSQDTRSSAASVIQTDTGGTATYYKGSTICGNAITTGKVLYKCTSSVCTTTNIYSASGWEKVETCNTACVNNTTAKTAACKVTATVAPTKAAAACSASSCTSCTTSSTCTAISGCKWGYVGSTTSCSKATVTVAPTATPKTVSLYYFDISEQTCKTTTSHATLAACNNEWNDRCYAYTTTGLTACKADFASCKSAGGICNTATVTCSGTRKTGLCPGNSNINCCVPKTTAVVTAAKATVAPTAKATIAPTAKPTVATTASFYYYDISEKTCKTITSYATLTACNSALDSRCYAYTTAGKSACDSSFSSCTTAKGTCMHSTSCTGTTKTGLCPGNSTISCCVPKATATPTLVLGNFSKIDFINGNVSNITDTTAKFTGTIESNSTQNISTYWVYYGVGTAINKSTTVYTANATSLNYGIDVTGLTPNTEYSYRATAKAADGTVNYDTIWTFKTKATATATVAPTSAVSVCASLGKVCANNSSCMEDDFTSTGMGCPTDQVCCTYGLKTITPTTVIAGCGVCPVNTTNYGKTRATGDSSCDGLINISDRSIIVDEIKNSLVIYGDLNCDGAVNVLDYGLWRDKFLSIH